MRHLHRSVSNSRAAWRMPVMKSCCLTSQYIIVYYTISQYIESFNVLWDMLLVSGWLLSILLCYVLLCVQYIEWHKTLQRVYCDRNAVSVNIIPRTVLWTVFPATLWLCWKACDGLAVAVALCILILRVWGGVWLFWLRSVGILTRCCSDFALSLGCAPRAGSVVFFVRIRLIRFLAGCRKRRLYQG